MFRIGRSLLNIRRGASKKLDISLWTDEKKNKPFKSNKTRLEKPDTKRYKVVDR